MPLKKQKKNQEKGKDHNFYFFWDLQILGAAQETKEKPEKRKEDRVLPATLVTEQSHSSIVSQPEDEWLL